MVIEKDLIYNELTKEIILENTPDTIYSIWLTINGIIAIDEEDFEVNNNIIDMTNSPYTLVKDDDIVIMFTPK